MVQTPSHQDVFKGVKRRGIVEAISIPFAKGEPEVGAQGASSRGGSGGGRGEEGEGVVGGGEGGGELASLQSIPDIYFNRVKTLLEHNAQLQLNYRHEHSNFELLRESTESLSQELEELRDYKKRSLQTESLLICSSALQGQRKLNNLFHVVMHELCQLLNADRATLFLVDEESGELWSQYAEGVKSIRLPAGTGLIGYTASTGESLNISDVQNDSRFSKELDMRTGYRTRNLLCMAIKSVLDPKEIIGAVQIINKVDGVFTKEDEKMLEHTVRQIAQAVVNCHSFAKTEKGLQSALAQVSDLESKLQRKKEEEEEKARRSKNTQMLLDKTPSMVSDIATASELHEMFQHVVCFLGQP